MQYFLSKIQNKEKPWFRNNKPWLVIGKGPSFDRLDLNSFPYRDYYTFALNHTSHILPKCTIAAIIDIEVLNVKTVENADNILLPWHVHKRFRPVSQDLNQLLHQNEVLKLADCRNTLMYYNLSTWKKTLEKDIVTVRYNIGELPFSILAKTGVKKIYSIGIDGGTNYAKTFSYLKPLTNGRSNFDDSIKAIKFTCQKFGIEWIRL